MSRYQIPASRPEHDIVVGWDPPLNTLFAHVTDMTKDEDDDGLDVLWIGCTLNEIHDVDELIKKIRPYAYMSHQDWSTLKQKLLSDMS